MIKTFKKIQKIKEQRGALSFALIDPDKKNDTNLKKYLDKINQADFDFILIGGSLIIDNSFEDRISLIKSHTETLSPIKSLFLS